MTSLSSSEIVSITTRVSGAIAGDVPRRVDAAHPRHVQVHDDDVGRELADDPAPPRRRPPPRRRSGRPAPRAGCGAPSGTGRGRPRSGRGATRPAARLLPAALRSAATPSSATSSLVERDRDRPAAPGARLRERREPEVDRRPRGRRCRVGGDGLAVAGDRQPRPERDHGGVDGDDAPADGKARRGVAGKRVAGRADGERPAAGVAGTGVDAGAAAAAALVCGEAGSAAWIASDLRTTRCAAACSAWICASFSCCPRRRLAMNARRSARAAVSAVAVRRASRDCGGERRAPRAGASRAAARGESARHGRRATTCWLWSATRLRSSSRVTASSSDCAPSTTASALDVALLVEQRQILAELAAARRRSVCRVAESCCASSCCSRAQLCRLLHRVPRAVPVRYASVCRAHTDRAARGARAHRAICACRAANRPVARPLAAADADASTSAAEHLRAAPQIVSWAAHEGGTVAQKIAGFRRLCAVRHRIRFVEVRAQNCSTFAHVTLVAGVRDPC